MTPGAKSPAACLIGWPAAHSRSPLIHRYWL
ncbi:MAG TPA: shikimate dehydrogenase, partial [Bradyrhizobium sp.]|nr:shikimate dehydrogenase [Bradyrhizobium sp.]